jgi:hypothetical protein
MMPLWGVWVDGSLAFSTGRQSVKASNLRHSPWCVVSTDNAAEPVVVEGLATWVKDGRILTRLCEAYAAKYGAPPPDLAEGPMFVLAPTMAFGFIERAEDFAASATRWVFPETAIQA